MGNIGRWLVDVTILVSQLGFCCAYLIFISENLSSYVSRVSKPQWLVILLPPLFLLTLLRHLHKLALFSFFAQVSNLFAFSVVFWFDFEHIHSVKKRFHPKEFSLKGFPFFFAMAIYCYEGAGMILSLEASCLKGVRHLFNRYFIITISFSTALYIAFGVSGYMSFGPETNEIITLNLSKGGGMNFAMLVKVCLCVSLFFTYPVMLFPVTKLLENRCLPVRENPVHLENFLRLVVVSVTGLIVTAVPNFANLMALVGATCCTLLAFILPGLFHILLFKNSITRGEWLFDCWLIFLGILGTVIGTTDAVIRLTSTSNVPVSSIALNVTNTSDLVL
ncbi:amino acid transporter AVT3B-like [Limulus polyphemus]|uniref:Amino acid transporter AVT3B-like n=1 Tax=Limulus polyphemus TaxID=6850 RepID=A0ABM1TBE7_LIMPO|nr:amino acid transporter AVT3B-like [Limulus polyphemus]